MSEHHHANGVCETCARRFAEMLDGWAKRIMADPACFAAAHIAIGLRGETGIEFELIEIGDDAVIEAGLDAVSGDDDEDDDEPAASAEEVRH